MPIHKAYLFTQAQGNLLICLLLAHILADFLLQPKAMANGKRFINGMMVLHIVSVFILTWLLGASYQLAAAIAISHWLIDGLKEAAKKKKKFPSHMLFVIDQGLHIMIIIFLWSLKFGLIPSCQKAVLFVITNYQISLLLLAYAIVIWPLGYLIKFALQKMLLSDNRENIEHGGKLIGQFERIIILTFVLLGQYEAIGFLITGKSIIRFAQKDEKLQSEYVLVGTMMSYALSIITGLICKFLM